MENKTKLFQVNHAASESTAPSYVNHYTSATLTRKFDMWWILPDLNRGCSAVNLG